MALLSVGDLSIAFRTRTGPVTAVDAVGFEVPAGRTVGLVGASGSGKTVTCHALLGLLPPNAMRLSGRARFDGTDVFRLDEAALTALRGGRIAMIFQDPTRSLNPVRTIGRQIGETLRLHRGLRGKAARREAEALLDLVGIAEAPTRLSAYPHELSGGMCQRVMIAMAVAARPRLLIADEPTTALDLTTQAQILDLLRDLQRRFGTAILLVTHDMGVVAEMAQDVVVLDRGAVAEAGPVARVFRQPAHAVTRAIVDDASRLPAPPDIVPPPLLAVEPGGDHAAPLR